MRASIAAAAERRPGRGAGGGRRYGSPMDFALPGEDDAGVGRCGTGWPNTPGRRGPSWPRPGYVAPLARAVGARRRPDPPAHHRRGAPRAGVRGPPTRSASAGPGRRSSRPAPTSNRSATCPASCRARTCGASCSANRAPARTWPTCRPGGARRRRVGDQRPEDLDVAGPPRPFGILIARTDPDAPKHTPASPTSCARWTPRHRDPADHRDDRRPHVQRGVPHRRALPAAYLVGEVEPGVGLAKVTLANERVSLSSGGVLWGQGPQPRPATTWCGPPAGWPIR
jgi:hypothetical protein